MKPTAMLVRGSWVALVGAIVACNAAAPDQSELTGKTESAVWTDGDFESGATGAVPPAPWALTTFINPNNTGYTPQTPQTLAGLNLMPGGVALTTTVFGATLSQPDPDMGALASFRWPRYGTKCARINQHSRTASGNDRTVNVLAQTMTVANADIDPSDGKIHVRFVVAPVLEDPNHPVNQQPYFFIQLTNQTRGGAVIFENFNFSNQSGVPWQTIVTGGLTYRYTDWQLVDIAPGSPAINVGDSVKLWLIAAGCSQGAHEGLLYVDGIGTTIPGLFVSGTGPAQANAGTNITYTMNYKNGSPSQACVTSANCAPITEACVGGFCAETNVVIDWTTPPGTTFQSFTAPPGATCVTPPVGGTGTIVCTFTNPMPPGTAGSFTVTVNINAGTAAGPLVCGNYDIKSTQETPLLGSKITTEVGCTLDADCTGGNWCHESAANACLPKLANGVAIPTDTGHTNPTLNGMCTVAAATLVCVSGVCDTADNKCGLANNHGPCTVANGGTVCRAGVCDPDLKCGLAVGDGPCTVGNGGTVCRTGFCSTTTGNCGCNVDTDCSGGNWCSISTHTCTPKVANGGTVPTDGPHMNPTLNGMCTVAAGTLTCVSGVCDTNDNKCGYANGDGPCTQGNAGTVCRSGMCSTTGTCEPQGGCNVDADCTGGNWCSISTHTCTAKVANGGTVPTDGPHMNPTLNGMCTVAAGTLTCVSGVCDTNDNKCGYADGDGPCTTGNGNVVCRGGACSTNGNCMPTGGCLVNADCMAPTPICNMGTHMCVAAPPDGGTDAGRDSGGNDSGAVDSGGNGDASPANDASVTFDSGAGSDAALEDDGTVAGGGISCSASPANGNSTNGLAAVAGVFLAAGAIVRRRRR